MGAVGGAMCAELVGGAVSPGLIGACVTGPLCVGAGADGTTNEGVVGGGSGRSTDGGEGGVTGALFPAGVGIGVCVGPLGGHI